MSQSNGLLIEDRKRRTGQTDPLRAQQWKEASQRYRDKKRRRIEELQAAVNSLEKDIEKLKQERNDSFDEVARTKNENQTLWKGFAGAPTAPMWRQVFNFEERLFDMLSQWKSRRSQEVLNGGARTSQGKESTPSSSPFQFQDQQATSSQSSPTSFCSSSSSYCHSSPSSPSTALVTNRYYNGNDFTQQQQQQHYNGSNSAPNKKKHEASFRPPPMAGNSSGNSPSSYVSASTQASEQAGGSGNNDDDGDSDGDSEAGAQLLLSSRLATHPPPVVVRPRGVEAQHQGVVATLAATTIPSGVATKHVQEMTDSNSNSLTDNCHNCNNNNNNILLNNMANQLLLLPPINSNQQHELDPFLIPYSDPKPVIPQRGDCLLNESYELRVPVPSDTDSLASMAYPAPARTF